MNYNLIEKTPSTNTFIEENVNNLPDWYVLRAIEQTNGRGRFERTWFCEKNKDLAMSVLIPCDEIILKNLPNITQITGISVAQVLEALPFPDTASILIKWPNDILIKPSSGETARKICGILTQALSVGEKTKIIAGIGLNVNSERKSADEICAVSLFDETKKTFDLDTLAKETAKKIAENLNRLRENGLSEFIEILNEKLAFKNEEKTFMYGKKQIFGTILGVGDGGELLLKTRNEILRIVSGEISSVS